jgi:hypothetical protein
MASKPDQRKKHHPVKISSLFGKLLPENYRQKNAAISQYQHFFNEQTGDAVFQMVEVTNVTDHQLVLAVPSPALVNYLRLHSQQIKSQLAGLFGQTLDIKIIAQPGSMERQPEINKQHKLKHFPNSVCAQIEKSASTLEDDELRRAMIALARTIKQGD